MPTVENSYQNDLFDTIPNHDLNITEAVEIACREPTLVDALSWIAVWESERAIKQARKYFETGVSTASHGGGWDTCFKVCLGEVLKAYATPCMKTGVKRA
jgi:hypothetical protein